MADVASEDAKVPATFLFYAPLSSEDNVVIDNFQDSVTLLRSGF
jgi:hypothetical protein